MKHIKKFTQFINEALKDEIPSHYRDIIKNDMVVKFWIKMSQYIPIKYLILK